MRRIKLEHSVDYQLKEPVRLLNHRLSVRPHEGQEVRIESSRLEPRPAYEIGWHRGVQGDSVAAANFSGPRQQLLIVSGVVVPHCPVAGAYRGPASGGFLPLEG